MYYKKLILVTSPPASGKTHISKKLAENLKHVVYLDKDTLIKLSNVIFEVAGEENNRSSQFFEDHVRNPEYDVVLDLAFEALQYEDLVLINAPFTREVRDEKWMNDLRKKLSKIGAKLCVVWVQTSLEVCRQRMIARNSERDTWKLAHWDEYVSTRDYSIPTTIKLESDPDSLLIFKNDNEKEYEESMKEIVGRLTKDLD